MSHHALQRANQQVAEQERVIAEWADMIGRMRDDDRDVTFAEELFDLFKGQLATYRGNRDSLQQSLRAKPAAPLMNGIDLQPCDAGPPGIGAFVVTDRAVAGQNLTSLTERLATERDPAKRRGLLNLLIDEGKRLGIGYEQLDIIDTRIAASHRLVERQRVLITRLARHGSDTQVESDILASLMHSRTFFEALRRQMLDKMDRLAL